jgi:predicted phage-related endonuclease
MELKEQKSQIDGESKKLEEKMKELYAGIVEDMGVSCTGILKDGCTEYTVTYNPAYRTAIDRKSLEKLKIQHPDVYDGYVNTTESRRFTVRKKEAA